MSEENHEPETAQQSEQIACFREEDLPKFHTGKISPLLFPVEREHAHAQQIPHLITRVFAISRAGRYLVQHRSPTRPSNPDKYTDSASGHVIYANGLDFEDLKAQATREMEEEVGTHPDCLEFLDFTYQEVAHELAYVFLAVVPEDLALNHDEVTDKTAFHDRDELVALLETEPFVDAARERWESLLEGGLLEDLLASFSSNGSTGPDCEEGVENQDFESRAGLFIGRFQPFHLGHWKVVEWILENHERVVIVIGSADKSRTRVNPFTVGEREQFTRATLLANDVPARRFQLEPVADQNDARAWRNLILERFPRDEIAVYSNSDWIRALFKEVDACLAPKRTFKFEYLNGTYIREHLDSVDDWNKFLPGPVQEFMREKGLDILRDVGMFKTRAYHTPARKTAVQALTIDGSHGEGGGSIVRLALALGVLTGTEVQLTNIRVKRKKSGLKTQHLRGVQALRDLCGGTIEGDALGSTELRFQPGEVYTENVTARIETAGSVGLFLQGFVLATCGPRNVTLQVEIEGGGTYGLWAPSTGYLGGVTYPLLQRAGISAHLTVNRHGFYPKGGARVQCVVEPPRLPLEPLTLDEFGEVQEAAGHVVVSSQLREPRVAERVGDAIEERLGRAGIALDDLKRAYVDTPSVGAGVDLWAATTAGGRPSSGTRLGKRGLSSERLGRQCARDLEAVVGHAIPVGDFLADQLVPYMGLANGTSRVKIAGLSAHAETNLWLLEQFFPGVVSWHLEDAAGGAQILEIQGVGFTGKTP